MVFLVLKQLLDDSASVTVGMPTAKEWLYEAVSASRTLLIITGRWWSTCA